MHETRLKSILTIFLQSIRESIGVTANLCSKARAIHLAEILLKPSDLSSKRILFFINLFLSASGEGRREDSTLNLSTGWFVLKS